MTSPSDHPDAAALEPLLHRVRHGDLDAFGEVVRRFEQPLRAFVHGRCPPWQMRCPTPPACMAST